MNEKLEYNANIDVLKTLAVIGVIYTHYGGGEVGRISTFFMLLSSFSVPLFLLINGYIVLAKNYSTRYFVIKSIKIFFQTTVWCLIYNLVFNVLFHEHRSFDIIIDNLYDGIYIGEFISIRNWFFYAICIIYFLSPFILHIFNQTSFTLIKYLFAILSIFIFLPDLVMRIFTIIQLMFNVNIVQYSNILNRINVFQTWDAFALIYFLTGGILLKFGYKIKEKLNIKKMLLISILLFFILLLYELFLLKFINSEFSVAWDVYPSVLLLIISSLIFYFFIHATIRYDKKVISFCNKISTNSFGIYFLHLLIGTFLKSIYFLNKVQRIDFGFSFVMVIFLLSYFTSNILRKIPFVKYLFIF